MTLHEAIRAARRAYPRETITPVGWVSKDQDVYILTTTSGLCIHVSAEGLRLANMAELVGEVDGMTEFGERRQLGVDEARPLL